MSLLTCAEFRVKRDAYQAQRRTEALPVLKTRQVELKAHIAALVAKRGERVSIALEEDIKSAQFERQYIWGQIAAIESSKL